MSRSKRSAKTTTFRAERRAHGGQLRAQGLRPIQIWVPDVRSPDFVAEARRQSRAVAESAQAREDQAFVDSISERRDRK